MKRVVSVLFLVVLMAACTGSGQAGTLAQETLEVTIRIPQYQNLEVTDPVVLDFTYPWPEASEGEPLVAEQAGEVKVLSNGDWVLQVEDAFHSGFDIFIRPDDGGWSPSDWQLVSGLRGEVYGRAGRHTIRWDLKVRPGDEVPVRSMGGEGRVEMLFTLSEN